eukprot:301897_1
MSLTTTTTETIEVESECESFEYQLWSIIHLLLMLTLLIITILFTHQFRKRQSQNAKRVGKLYCLGITFAITTTITFFLYLGLDICCILYIPDLVLLIRTILLFMFFIQYWLMLLLYFSTVQHVFIGTEHQLSGNIFNGFIGLLVVSIIAIILVILTPPGSSISNFVGILAGVTCTGLMIFLLFLFSSKLLKLAKVDSNNARVMSIVAKTTILIMISALLTLLDIIIAGIRGNMPKNHLIGGTYLFISSLDTFTNFFCIMLSYDIFKRYYKKICNCLHKQLSNICLSIANKGVPQAKLAQYVHSMSKTSVATLSVNSSGGSADKSVTTNVEISAPNTENPPPTSMTNAPSTTDVNVHSTTDQQITNENNNNTT